MPEQIYVHGKIITKKRYARLQNIILLLSECDCTTQREVVDEYNKRFDDINIEQSLISLDFKLLSINKIKQKGKRVYKYTSPGLEPNLITNEAKLIDCIKKHVCHSKIWESHNIISFVLRDTSKVEYFCRLLMKVFSLNKNRYGIIACYSGIYSATAICADDEYTNEIFEYVNKYI